MLQDQSPSATNNLEAFWMPFTANRQFKKKPRMLVARRGHVLLDATTGARCSTAPPGLWCVNAGHGRPEIVEAIARAGQELDYAPAFQMGHPKVFELAARLVDAHAAGPRPCLLHQFRLGIGRDRR